MAIVNNTQTHLNQRKERNLQQVPRVETQQVPRVNTNEPIQAPTCPSDNHNPNRTTNKTTNQWRSWRHSLLHLTAKITLPTATPAMSTRSKVRMADERQRVTCLRQPTKSSIGKTRWANAVITKPNWQRLLNKMEQDVERALAVMDQDSGKMMTYRQLRKQPKFNKTWTTSSANEFGRLANGVGGQVKGTNTIQFIKHDNVPQKRRKDVIYGSFQCNVRPKKTEEPKRQKNPTVPAS